MNNNLHIDVVTKYFYPVTAGIETNILETYSVLVKSGWNVTIHTTQSTLDKKNTLPDTDSIRGINIIRYREGIFGYYPSIDYNHTNLICLHNFNILPHLIVLIKAFMHRLIGLKKYGIFLTPHGGFTPEWPMFPIISRIFKRIYHQSLGLMMINTVVDGVRSISNWEKESLIKVGINPKNIYVIENGLDPIAKLPHTKLASIKIKKIVKMHSPYIMAIGRINRIKNYETIIKSLSIVDHRLKLIIVGPIQDQSYKDELSLLAEKLGVARRVTYLGVVRGSDKYYLMQKSIALVHMARWESFCNVVYEAMSLGKICIVAANTALLSLVENNQTGFVVPTYSTSHLAKVICKLLYPNSTDLIDKISLNLKSRKFPTWISTAKKMDLAYKNIVGIYE